MKISEYVKGYTSGERILFRHICGEVEELFEALISLRAQNIREEFEDVFHFLQVWLFWRFRLDGEIWNITRGSVKKFMDRREVWRKIYRFVGLPENISNYAGNYKRKEKVVTQLAKFNISEESSLLAFWEIIERKNPPKKRV